MTVQELITELMQIGDKDLPIRIHNTDAEDEENDWVVSIEYNNTGQSGYEVSGEVILLTSK
jgi:hypothetical protein